MNIPHLQEAKAHTGWWKKAAEKYPAMDLDEAFADFADYWQAPGNKTKAAKRKDWKRSFLRWLVNASKYQGSTGEGARKRSKEIIAKSEKAEREGMTFREFREGMSR